MGNCGPGTQIAYRRCSDSSGASRTQCVGSAPSKTQDCKLKECVTIDCEKETMCVKFDKQHLKRNSVDSDNDGVPDSNYGSFLPKISEVVTVVPIDMVKGGIKGDGKFPVAMMMYKSDEYSTVYDSPPTLNVDSRLYIQTHLLKGPDEATVQTKKCWMTSTKDIDGTPSYTIIDDFCPVADAVAKADVDLITNGKNFVSRWEVDVFKFTGKDNIFVHCRVRLCFKSADQKCDVFNCQNRRKRRDVQEGEKADLNINIENYEQDDDITVSIGPLSVDDKVLEITIQNGGGLSQPTCIIIGAIVAIVVMALLIFAIYRRRSKEESRVQPEKNIDQVAF